MAAAFVGAFAIIVSSFLSPIAGHSDPAPTQTVAQVTAKLDQMAQQSEALTEQYNTATADVSVKQKAADDAKTAADAAVASYETARTQLSATIAADYEGSSMSRTGALLTSQNGQGYLDTLNTISLITVHRADVLSMLDTAKAKADSATKSAATLLSQAKATQASVASQKSVIEASISKYKATLASLTAAQQAAYTNRNTVPLATAQAVVKATTPAAPVATAAPAPTAAAGIAVAFALSQVGKPYVFAAAGPGSYDCSGLTMASWAHAGVKLPHNAAAQYGYGTHIAESDLQPGDLVFMYHPIGHVTIYIGNGLLVSAPQPGEDVKVVTLAAFQRDYTGATRLT